MKGSRTRLRKVLSEREREEAAVSGSDRAPNFQGSAGRERNPVRGLAQLASLWLHCLSGLEASAYLFRPLLLGADCRELRALGLKGIACRCPERSGRYVGRGKCPARPSVTVICRSNRRAPGS